MDEQLQWLLAGLGLCLLAAWLARAAFRRRQRKAETDTVPDEASVPAQAQPATTDDAVLADTQRRAQADQARATATRLAAEKAAQSTAARLAAQRAERAQAARVAAESAAHEEALHRAQRDAARAETARVQAQHEAHQAREAHEAAEHSARLHEARRVADDELRAVRARAAAQEAQEAQAAQQAQQAQAAQRIEAERRAAALAAVKTPAQTLVLVADDSKVVRVKTGRLLAQHEYRVCFASDGLDALQQLQTSVPDVLITDVEMPGMDGFELTRHVRQNPATAQVPIIMITAADERHRADAQRAGVSVLLGKPYPDEALIEHIRRAMHPGLEPSDAQAADARSSAHAELDALA